MEALKMEIDYTQKLNLLLVDDVPAHRFMMASGIKRINPFCTVDEAANIEEAIALLSGKSYTAVISDWSMPGGGGGELIKWMRARTHFRRVPFIMISSRDDNEDIIKAFMELGVDAYVVKPFVARDLYDKMVAAVEKRQKSRRSDDSPT
jgi:two-component system chemotaxis response regulator CheY